MVVMETTWLYGGEGAVLNDLRWRCLSLLCLPCHCILSICQLYCDSLGQRLCRNYTRCASKDYMHHNVLLAPACTALKDKKNSRDIFKEVAQSAYNGATFCNTSEELKF
jgi:hypothetical protein